MTICSGCRTDMPDQKNVSPWGLCPVCEARREKGLPPFPSTVIKAEPVVHTPVPDALVRAGHPRYYAFMEMAMAIHAAKNADYATGKDPLSNFKECEKGGVSAEDGCYTRLSDKWCRIQNLLKKERTGGSPKVKESVEDTLLDMINYCAILLVLREEGVIKK